MLFDGDWMLARFCYVDAKCSLALCNLLIWFCEIFMIYSAGILLRGLLFV